ncbi:aminotransferase class I/II-fold pyridoxal phosphate-dependent enzyme [Azospirillum sp. sgz302134]
MSATTGSGHRGVGALIVNSPENPTGYVASLKDWKRIGALAAANGTWIIHDEVYDVMDFERPPRRARTASPCPGTLDPFRFRQARA